MIATRTPWSDVSAAGGTAFPARADTMHPGMSLRDWFAGQALAGLMGNALVVEKIAKNHPGPIQESAVAICHSAYALADAMLAQRDKPR